MRKIVGTGGPDQIVGTFSPEQLFGRRGSDWLLVGNGDIAYGGKGLDEFQISTAFVKDGQATIGDLRVGEPIIFGVHYLDEREGLVTWRNFSIDDGVLWLKYFDRLDHPHRFAVDGADVIEDMGIRKAFKVGLLDIVAEGL